VAPRLVYAMAMSDDPLAKVALVELKEKVANA
jgi:hypothetical protein